MKITGVSFKQFQLNTLAALAAAGICKTDRISLANKFLNFQLFPEQKPGQNEHTLVDVFADEAEQKEPVVIVDLPHTANIVSLVEYDHDVQGNLSEYNTEQFICIGEEAINDKLRSIFENNYPEHADGAHILNSMLVTNTIRTLVEDEDDEETDFDELENKFQDEISELDNEEACQWLLTYCSIDELTDEGFFSDFLHSELMKVSYQSADIHY